MGIDEPILAGRRVLEKELERHQKKLEWAEEHGEAIGSTWSPNASRPRVRSWRRCKRISESGKETPRVAFEELKILREDLQREGESMDKNRRHVPSLERLEEVRTMQLDGTWRRADTNGLYHDFEEKLEARRAQVLASDWFRTDHRAVLAVLSLKSKLRYFRNLE